MPAYTYKAIDKSGAVVSGTMSGNDANAIADLLINSGLSPVTIDIKKSPVISSFLSLNKIKPYDVMLFSRQLATLLSAGLSFISSLETLIEQTMNISFREKIVEIKQDIEKGESFSTALSKHNDIFSKTYVSMVSAGEKGGFMNMALDRLALLSEKDIETRLKVKGALRYPIILVTISLIVIGFMLSVILPKFIGIFTDAGVKLPLATQILLGLSLLVQRFWYLILIFIAAVIILFKKKAYGEKGRFFIDHLKLKIPLYKDLHKKFIIVNFARTMGMMSSCGIGILDIMEILSNVVGNEVVANQIRVAAVRIKEGEVISKPLKDSGLFPPLVIQMIAIGEDTGKIDYMSEKIAEYYEKDLDYTIKNLTTTLEPLLLVIMGGIVGFIALSTLLPIFEMTRLIHR